MKRDYRVWILLALLVALLVTAVACGGASFKIGVDEDGLATWDPVKAAVGYEYCFVFEQDGHPTSFGSQMTTDTFVQIPEGYWLELRPIFEGGKTGAWTKTAIFGDTANRVDLENFEPWYPEDPSEPSTDTPSDPSSLPNAVIRVSEDGTATWDAVEGAIGYHYAYMYYEEGEEYPFAIYEEETAEPLTLPMQDGYALRVETFFGEDGLSSFAQTEIYGDPALRTELRYGYIFPGHYEVRWEELKHYELIGNIVPDSVVVAEDGTVTFNAVGPKGETMRFYGRGVRVEEGSISMMPGAFLTALDAIGRIMVYETMTDKMPIEYESNDANYIWTNGGYTFTDETHVDGYEDLTYAMGWSGYVAGNRTAYVDDGKSGERSGVLTAHDVLYCQPNFISLNASFYTEENVNLYELHIYYEEVYTSEVRYVGLNADFYTAYLEGERYDVAKEGSVMAGAVTEFYLVIKPELRGELDPPDYEAWMANPYGSLFTVSPTVYQIGELRDDSGKVLNKETSRLAPGATLDITIGDRTFDLPLTVLPTFNSADIMHDLVPYAYPKATGTINALVIPIGWQDEPEHADDDEYARFRAELGRVMDEKGNVTDYSFDSAAEQRFSLSEYYDIASYGKLTVQSFMTDWYRAPYDFAEMRDAVPEKEFTDELLDWLYETYPNMDWTQFDGDGNGYFDAVILLNAGSMGDGFNIISFGGGIMTMYTYTGENAGTSERPTINCFTNMNAHMFDDKTLIHEFAHNLGLIDYYDVTYSGIDAVGSFDMQSGSYGDWNVYSKYAVGWLEPEVVTGLSKGESVEITIGASALTGDAIVIPGAASDYNGTPFDEYIMIDLFADAGVNEYDADYEFFDLDGATGVRIYHVNALMEKRELTVDGEVYPIGTVHTANSNTGDGKFNLELIQAGGVNTFTDMSNLRTELCEDDLFVAGDSFTVEDYSSFFGDGLLDDGTAFGYKIEIVSLTEGENPAATIRITRQ